MLHSVFGKQSVGLLLHWIQNSFHRLLMGFNFGAKLAFNELIFFIRHISNSLLIEFLKLTLTSIFIDVYQEQNFPNFSHQIFSIDTTNTDDNFLNILINYLIEIANQFIVASIYYEISKDYLCNLVYLFNLSQIPNFKSLSMSRWTWS